MRQIEIPQFVRLTRARQQITQTVLVTSGLNDETIFTKRNRLKRTFRRYSSFLIVCTCVRAVSSYRSASVEHSRHLWSEVFWKVSFEVTDRERVCLCDSPGGQIGSHFILSVRRFLYMCALCLCSTEEQTDAMEHKATMHEWDSVCFVGMVFHISSVCRQFLLSSVSTSLRTQCYTVIARCSIWIRTGHWTFPARWTEHHIRPTIGFGNEFKNSFYPKQEQRGHFRLFWNRHISCAHFTARIFPSELERKDETVAHLVLRSKATINSTVFYEYIMNKFWIPISIRIQ